MTTMKKIALVAACVAADQASALSEHDVYAARLTPGTVSYDALVDNKLFETSGATDVIEGEAHRTGVLQVTNIPQYAELRKAVLAAAPGCARVSAAARSSTFKDGTTRVTIASETAPEVGQAGVAHGEAAKDACAKFDKVSDAFRKVVSRTSQLFAERLGGLYGSIGAGFLERDTAAGDEWYSSLGELTSNGHHLEHFHSYVSDPALGAPSLEEATVELHTDQGLFISFTPPMMVDAAGNPTGGAAGRFFVEMRDGSVMEADFDENSLVFMLGDGINRYVNLRLNAEMPELRAAPHALLMPAPAKGLTWRSWYGRMFLPPSDAIVEDGETAGTMRAKLVAAAQAGDVDADVLHTGCSGKQEARELSEESCAEGTIFCWARCMEYPEGVSVEECAAKDMELNCTSQYNQISLGNQHGDYNPSCHNIDPDNLVTPHPTIPADEGDCALEDVVDMEAYEGYRKMGPKEALQWNIVDGGIEGALTYAGKLGWMSFGLANPEGSKNGMSGAKVVLGSVDKGGDSTMVHEYQIHESLSAFRHWDTPKDTDGNTYSMEISSCKTVMTFKLKSIVGQSFDLENENFVIYGRHTSTWRHQYHGGSPEDRKSWMLDFNDFKESSAGALTATFVGALLLQRMLN